MSPLLQAARACLERALRLVKLPAGARANEFRSDLLIGARNGALLGLAAAVLLLPAAERDRSERASLLTSAPAATALHAPSLRRADFRGHATSPDARAIAEWVARSRDNRGLPFAVLDKRSARLHVFDRDAIQIDSTLVLLGSAVGDDTGKGVGNKALHELPPHERTTPAGRFISEPGHDIDGDDVVWVDYDAAVAMHRVHVVDPKERRFERIATPFADDKRISNGCINVPIAFFDRVVKPLLGASHGVVYVLPDVKPLGEVFADAVAATVIPATPRRAVARPTTEL